MLGSVELLWLVLTLLVSATSLLALVQPNWVLNPDTFECFGPLTRCQITSAIYSYFTRRSCGFHDDEFVYLRYPSLPWQLLALVYSVGTALLGVSGVVGVYSAVCLKREVREKIAAAASYTQGMAVILSFITIATFPLLLGNSLARGVCGEDVTSYSLGGCQLGWSYMLAIASTAIGAFCPYLAQHTDVMLDGVDRGGGGEVRGEGPQVCTVEGWGEGEEEVGPVITASETNSSFKSTSTFSSFLNV